MKRFTVWWQRFPQLGGLGYVPCDFDFPSRAEAQAYVRQWRKDMGNRAPRLEVRPSVY